MKILIIALLLMSFGAFADPATIPCPDQGKVVDIPDRSTGKDLTPVESTAGSTGAGVNATGCKKRDTATGQCLDG